MREERPAKTVSIVMIIMLLGKVLGLIRTTTTASFLGTSPEMDAFTQASMIPRNFLDFAFASAISSSFIPVFNGYLEKSGRESAFSLADKFITLILILSGLATILLILFADPVVALLAPGYDPVKRALCVRLLRVMLPTIVATALAFSATGVLQSLGEFNIPAAMSVTSNVIVIGYLLIFMDKLGVTGLSWAFLIGWATQFLILLPPLIKRGYIPKFRLDIKDPGILQIGALMLPVMVSSWVFPINTLVNNSAVSGNESWQAALGFANELYMVITGVFILSVANVIFPALSKQTAQNDDKAFVDTMRATLRVLFLILPPMTAGLLALGAPIVALFYQRGSFNAESTATTVGALCYYVPGMLGFGVQTILSRGFYAEGSGRVPLLTGIGAIVINAGLSFPLVKVLGVGGPALASSISISFIAAIMLYFMQKKNQGILDKAMGIDLLKSIALSILVGLGAYGMFAWLGQIWLSNGFFASLIKLLFIVCVLAAGFLGAASALKIPEARIVTSAIQKIFRRKART